MVKRRLIAETTMDDAIGALLMEPCPENQMLSAAVVEAVQALYAAKHALDAATQKKGDTQPFAVALTQSRAKEKEAVKALDAHKKEHGC